MAGHGLWCRAGTADAPTQHLQSCPAILNIVMGPVFGVGCGDVWLASCVHGNSKVRAEKLENVIGSAVVIYSCHVQAEAEHSFHPRPLGFGPPRDHLAPAKTLPAALFPPQQSSTDHCRCRAANRVLYLPVILRYLLGASTLPHRGSRVSCQRTLRSLKQTRSSALVYFVPSTAHSSHLYRGLIAYNVILL